MWQCLLYLMAMDSLWSYSWCPAALSTSLIIFNTLGYPQWSGEAKTAHLQKLSLLKENKHVLDYHSSIYVTANIFSTLSLVFSRARNHTFFPEYPLINAPYISSLCSIYTGSLFFMSTTEFLIHVMYKHMQLESLVFSSAAYATLCPLLISLISASGK